MNVRSKAEMQHDADALFRGLRDLDFLAHLDDATLQGQAKWAVGMGLDRVAFLRLVYFLGCQAGYKWTELEVGVVSAITGAPMSAFGWRDDLPF